MNVVPMTPITTVKVLRNVPLDSTYTDTLTFGSTSAQIAYFNGKTKYTFNNLGPVRLQNAIRLPTVADNLFDCNYIMFQNSNFGSKWFYAFITSIDFINTNMCQVNIELDVWQTWYFNISIKESFVLREHVNNDAIGANLVPENLETGEYVNNSIDEFDLSEQYICAMTSLSSSLEPASGRTISGVYTGLNVIAGIPVSDPTSINEVLSNFIDQGREDAIAILYQYPAFCGDASSSSPSSTEKIVSPNTANINGYIPKNNKLFTHPYNFIVISNNDGQSALLRYENFNDPNNITFKIVGTFVSTPCVLAYPRNHRNITEDYDSGLVISNFPQCAWTGDAFKAWISQNKGNLLLSGMASTGTAIGGTLTGNPVAVGVGLTGIARDIAKIYDHAQIPPQAHGQIQCDSLNSGMNRVKFSFYKMSIKAQFAKIIDDYWSKYGYQVNALKVPNITGRPSWNYVQTDKACVTGSVPFNDINTIKSSLNNGITFWHGDWVGDYSRNNKAGV